MSTKDDFRTTVNRSSSKERDKRVAELVSDGFNVISLFSNVDESQGSRAGVNRYGTRKQYDGGMTRANYGAILSRPNVEK